ncbi:hypothetical protein QFZ96_001101 [Paraburkholderia youngii]
MPSMLWRMRATSIKAAGVFKVSMLTLLSHSGAYVTTICAVLSPVFNERIIGN